jgi:hypothetical protein
MKIKVRNWIIDTKTLFRIEWKKFYPKIVFHEKYETKIKWILRILTLIGLLTSFITLEPQFSFLLSLCLLLIEQFLERIIFEYSVIIVKPFPKFKFDNTEWLTNGYLFPQVEFYEGKKLPIYFGFVFKSKQYGYDFFQYIKEWIANPDDDKEKQICLSFVIENNNTYSTYLYPNTNLEKLKTTFNKIKEDKKIEKYGKEQQSMIMSISFSKVLELDENSLFQTFINKQPRNFPFYFEGYYLENNEMITIENTRIKLYDYKISNRKEINEDEIENITLNK